MAWLAATRPVAWSSEVQYWRGRKSRFANDDSCARVIVITSWTVRTVGDRGAGDEVLRRVDDLGAGGRELRPARVALPERHPELARASGIVDHRVRGGRPRAGGRARSPIPARRRQPHVVAPRERRDELARVAPDPARAIDGVGQDADAKGRVLGSATFLHVRLP